jgi:DNA replication protein DnaC
MTRLSPKTRSTLATEESPASSNKKCHERTSSDVANLAGDIAAKYYVDLREFDTRSWQFQNRNDELAKMKKLVEEFHATGNILVLLLHGPPGIGKTELAFKFRKDLQSR